MNDTKIMLAYLAGFAVFTSGVIYLAACVSSLACESQANVMRFNHSWTMLNGCMIEPEPGKWVPLKNYRAM